MIIIPSEVEKHDHLGDLFARRGHDTFIESGTHAGRTVQFFQSRARRVASVEIDPGMHALTLGWQAEGLIHPNARLILGDSTEWIPRLVAESDSAPLVFLDGHYSGEGTGRGGEDEPAVSIMRAIGRASPRGTTVVVDDLHTFGTEPDWPTLDALVWYARQSFPVARIYCACNSLVVEG